MNNHTVPQHSLGSWRGTTFFSFSETQFDPGTRTDPESSFNTEFSRLEVPGSNRFSKSAPTLSRSLPYGRPLYYFTMKVIASVEKYENAGMKFSTVPAFALAECRASDACCLFLVHMHEVSVFSSPGKFRASCASWIKSGIAHSLDPRAATRAVPVSYLPAAAHAALL